MSYRDGDGNLRARVERLEDELRDAREQRDENAALKHRVEELERAKGAPPDATPGHAPPIVDPKPKELGPSVVDRKSNELGPGRKVFLYGFFGMVGIMIVGAPGAVLAACGPLMVSDLGRTVAPLACPSGYVRSYVTTSSSNFGRQSSEEWELHCKLEHGEETVDGIVSHPLLFLLMTGSIWGPLAARMLWKRRANRLENEAYFKRTREPGA